MSDYHIHASPTKRGGEKKWKMSRVCRRPFFPYSTKWKTALPVIPDGSSCQNLFLEWEQHLLLRKCPRKVRGQPLQDSHWTRVVRANVCRKNSALFQALLLSQLTVTAAPRGKVCYDPLFLKMWKWGPRVTEWHPSLARVALKGPGLDPRRGHSEAQEEADRVSVDLLSWGNQNILLLSEWTTVHLKWPWLYYCKTPWWAVVLGRQNTACKSKAWAEGG